MKKVYFKVSGNKALAYQLKHRAFLTSCDRLKSGSDFGKSYRNDTSTYISMPISFYKENFTYCRSSGIYRSSLQWGDLIPFMQVEQFTGKGFITLN